MEYDVEMLTNRPTNDYHFLTDFHSLLNLSNEIVGIESGTILRLRFKGTPTDCKIMLLVRYTTIDRNSINSLAR